MISAIPAARCRYRYRGEPERADGPARSLQRPRCDGAPGRNQGPGSGHRPGPRGPHPPAADESDRASTGRPAGSVADRRCGTYVARAQGYTPVPVGQQGSGAAADLQREHESGRRESNPREQPGRLVTHPGRPLQFAAMTRAYTISASLCRTFGSNFGRNRRRTESVKAGAAQSGSMHPAIRLLEQSSPSRVVAPPCRYERSGCGPGPTRCYDRPGQRATGSRVILPAIRITACSPPEHGVQATPGR